MKKIPESFELDEDDIREAIIHWLNEEHSADKDYHEYSVEFKVDKKESPPPGGHRGGMSDPIITTVITAVAVKDD